MWEMIGSVKYCLAIRIFLMMFVEAFLPVWVVAVVSISLHDRTFRWLLACMYIEVCYQQYNNGFIVYSSLYVDYVNLCLEYV